MKKKIVVEAEIICQAMDTELEHTQLALLVEQKLNELGKVGILEEIHKESGLNALTHVGVRFHFKKVKEIHSG